MSHLKHKHTEKLKVRNGEVSIFPRFISGFNAVESMQHVPGLDSVGRNNPVSPG